MAGAILWTCPSLFCVAGAVLYTRRVTCFFADRIVRAASRCKFRGMRGILRDGMKIDGSLAGNTDFGVLNFLVLSKTRRKTSILKLQSVKIGGSLVRNVRFDVPTCLVSSLWFSCGFAVLMGEAGEAAKPLLFEGVQAGCHVVLQGTRGTLWHFDLFDNVSKAALGGRILLRRLHKMSCSCSGAFWRSLSSFCVADQHFRRFGLPALHSTLYAPQSTIHPLHTTQHTLHSTL